MEGGYALHFLFDVTTKILSCMQVDMFNNLVCEVEAVYRPIINPSKNPKIATSQQAVDYVRPAYTEIIDFYERTSALFLNRNNHVIGLMKVCDGTRGSAMVDIPRIFQLGLKVNAHRVILFHNHPSGNPSPSEQDIKLTKRINNIGKLLEITVCDHIILTRDSYYSFQDNGDC